VYGKEKIGGRGAERNLPDFFGLCPRCQKHFPEKLSKIVVDGGGGGGGRDYEKFLLDSIFPTKLTEFPTKLTEFVPFIFIISQYCPTVKRILPAWLCLPPRPVPHEALSICDFDRHLVCLKKLIYTVKVSVITAGILHR
jgi:hypothetical protein